MRGSLLLMLFILASASPAQEKCATSYIKANQQRQESPDQFEGWLKHKVIQKQALLRSQEKKTQTIYEIPVVFHVIHDGSQVGSGSNLPDEKLLEQIQILNDDFRRTNADASETPARYLDVATDTEISFVLARQDPEGLPTNGIVRLRGSKDTYSPSEDQILMSESYWPHADYLNIYVTDLTSGNLGYAQFPFSNLDGIASQLENYISTDGVVLDYAWVGNNESTGSSFDSKGRTATHEIGHYLGLRHIWGDGGCGQDDFCEDTPTASNASTGCPSNKVTCDTQDMIQNYMDYTDDRCMNLFTACQKTRMRTVLEESPRRASLLTSHALNEPTMVGRDLGIRSIIAPTQAQCSAEVIPGIQVRNYGMDAVTSFRVALYRDGTLLENIDQAASLTSLETTEVSFSPISLASTTPNDLTFRVVLVNGATDQNGDNDEKMILLPPLETAIIPFYEPFEENPDYHQYTENGGTSMWAYTTAPGLSVDNQSAFLPFYNQQTNFGYQDLLLTRTLDLSGLTSAQLDFSYAYAVRSAENLDGLIVAVSTNCGQDFPRKNFVFERYGKNLNTAGTSDFSFIPGGPEDWESVNLNITKYAGEEQVQIAFIGINGGGNNIFLDNVSVTSANLLAFDLGIKTVEAVPIVTCQTSASPKVEIKNFGYEDITTLEFQFSINNQTETQLIQNIFLPSGHSEIFTLNTSGAMVEGENEFVFNISEINGRLDEQVSNNQKVYYGIVNSDEDRVPVQENFEKISWVLAHPSGTAFLDTTTLSGNKLLYSNSFENGIVGKSYLVSPELVTGSYDQGAIRFDYSYAQRTGYNDNLKVLLSTNCGRTFEKEVLSLNSEQMAVKTSNTEWAPSSKEDWKTAFVDISEHMVWPGLRVAFVFSNGNGNRLYIDNINVLTTNDPSLPEFESKVQLYPNPATSRFRLAFNLPEKETVNIKLVDMSGRIVFDENFSNIINQTLELKAPSQSGFYVVHVSGKGINHSKRLFIRQ